MVLQVIRNRCRLHFWFSCYFFEASGVRVFSEMISPRIVECDEILSIDDNFLVRLVGFDLDRRVWVGNMPQSGVWIAYHGADILYNYLK
jgi:hypothetical protein